MYLKDLVFIWSQDTKKVEKLSRLVISLQTIRESEDHMENYWDTGSYSNEETEDYDYYDQAETDQVIMPWIGAFQMPKPNVRVERLYKDTGLKNDMLFLDVEVEYSVPCN